MGLQQQRAGLPALGWPHGRPPARAQGLHWPLRLAPRLLGSLLLPRLLGWAAAVEPAVPRVALMAGRKEGAAPVGHAVLHAQRLQRWVMLRELQPRAAPAPPAALQSHHAAGAARAVTAPAAYDEGAALRPASTRSSAMPKAVRSSP